MSNSLVSKGIYKNFFNNCKSAIISQKVSSILGGSKKGLSLCFNILEVKVDSKTEAILTMTVLYNGRKRGALSKSCFSSLCSLVEGYVLEFAENYNKKFNARIPYFLPLNDYIKGDGWYESLRCHRVFIIPYECYGDLFLFLKSKAIVESLLKFRAYYNDYYRKKLEEAERNEEKIDDPVTHFKAIPFRLYTSNHSGKYTDIVD